MLKLGPLVILTGEERMRLDVLVARAEAELNRAEHEQAQVRARQDAVYRRMHELMSEARRERDLATARAAEYQGLFVEQQAEIESLRRQLSVTHHPSTQPGQDEQ